MDPAGVAIEIPEPPCHSYGRRKARKNAPSLEDFEPLPAFPRTPEIFSGFQPLQRFSIAARVRIPPELFLCRQSCRPSLERPGFSGRQNDRERRHVAFSLWHRAPRQAVEHSCCSYLPAWAL